MLILALIALVTSSTAPSVTVFEKYKGSVFTIEVHSTGSEARQVLGSGYLLGRNDRLVTNFHVVSSFVDEPDRYSIRAKNHLGTYPAKLLTFDLTNDLAILEIPAVAAEPLNMASSEPARGSSIVSLGNPEGLGLSLIEGVFNGYAEKGFIDRLLLSMPLNAGMSGGPILDHKGRVVGTNVSVVWLANSLSFGVPAAKLRPLIDAPPLKISRESLREATRRQLAGLERTTFARAIAPMLASEQKNGVSVGAARLLRPPEVFECWSRLNLHKEEGVTTNQYSCNLQFTPTIDPLGPVGSVELLVEHALTRGNSYGFYAALAKTAEEYHDVSPVDPTNGVMSAPECVSERVSTDHITFRVGACVSAYVKYPGLYSFDLVAMSVSQPRQAATVTIHGRGLSLKSFTDLARVLLASIRLNEAP